MVERKSASRRRYGARRARIALAGTWILVAAALATSAPALAQDRDKPRSVEKLWDAYPLHQARDRATQPAAAGSQPPSMQAASTGSDDVQWTALALTLALLAGGVSGWLLSLRGPHARVALMPALAARPATAPVRLTTPRLWAPSGGAPSAEPAPPAAPRERPALTSPPPAPPAPERAWAAEIEWHPVDGAAQFRVAARSVEGGDEPITLGASSLLEWPPAGPRSVQALTDAVKRLESTLVGAGWTPLPGGTAWYAKRFTWQPGARPPVAQPTVARERHRTLYEAEYARQVDRTLRLRRAITARVIPPRRPDDDVGTAPD